MKLHLDTLGMSYESAKKVTWLVFTGRADALIWEKEQ
jgi:hypothetical protein